MRAEPKNNGGYGNPTTSPYIYSRLQKSCNTPSGQWNYHIWISLSLPPQHALPLGSSTIHQLWFPLFSLLVARLLQSSVHNNNASHDILATFPCSFLIGSLSTRPSHMEGSGSETSTWVGRLGMRLVTFVPTHQRGWAKMLPVKTRFVPGGSKTVGWKWLHSIPNNGGCHEEECVCHSRRFDWCHFYQLSWGWVHIPSSHPTGQKFHLQMQRMLLFLTVGTTFLRGGR